MSKLKNIDINKAIKLSIMAGVLLVSFSFFYHYVIFLPQKEQAKIEREKQEQLGACRNTGFYFSERNVFVLFVT